jgi:hypothetical protein
LSNKTFFSSLVESKFEEVKLDEISVNMKKGSVKEKLKNSIQIKYDDLMVLGNFNKTILLSLKN